jgi:hypothetical protein
MNLRHLLLQITLFAMSTLSAAPDGFLFAILKDEQIALTGQIYFALKANSRTWIALKNSEPLLVSELGEKDVPAPHLLK